MKAKIPFSELDLRGTTKTPTSREKTMRNNAIADFKKAFATYDSDRWLTGVFLKFMHGSVGMDSAVYMPTIYPTLVGRVLYFISPGTDGD